MTATLHTLHPEADVAVTSALHDEKRSPVPGFELRAPASLVEQARQAEEHSHAEDILTFARRLESFSQPGKPDAVRKQRRAAIASIRRSLRFLEDSMK